MQKIYCLVERTQKALENFLDAHDNDSEIHVYSSVIDSCEERLFFCMGQIVTFFFENEGKSFLVTDVPEIYQLSVKLCGSLYQEIYYIEQNVEREFLEKLDLTELLEFSCNMLSDVKEEEVISALFAAMNSSDLMAMYEISDSIRGIMEQDGWRKKAYWSYLCKLLLMSGENGAVTISEEYTLFLMSLLMKLEHKPEHTNAYLERILQSEKYQKENYYFVWNQFKNIAFKKLAETDSRTSELLELLYRKCFGQYRKSLEDYLFPIPKEKRDKSCVIILTIQFLGNGHAPTRTVIERCKALKKLGKEVYLINTVEQYTVKGYLPMYDALGGRVCSEYEGLHEVAFDGEKIGFYQLSSKMPIMNRFYSIVELVRNIKPYYILSIGSGSILADLCGQIVPCASMALVFSTLPHTMNPMKILGRKLGEKEEINGDKSDIIESRFTFELKEQTKKFNRKQFMISEDAFLIAVVGIRLDFEVTEEFLEMLEKICKKGCHIAFAGIFEHYEKIVKNYPKLKTHSSFIGYCDDMLAFMELCDLYVNPKRLGGGFSVIEAFQKGVPGVYLKEGDVYTAGGEEFSVNDFGEMEQIILRYKEDKPFYKSMSEHAVKRAKLMTSSMEAMEELDHEICSRVEMKYW